LLSGWTLLRNSGAFRRTDGYNRNQTIC
jgi:hypothetical protein